LQKVKVMHIIKIVFIGVLSAALFACGAPQNQEEKEEVYYPELDTLKFENEVYLRNLRQLTFGGDNAEAYWSFDGKSFVFQVTNPAWNVECDQIYVYNFEKQSTTNELPTMVSTGLGRTTCSYFLPGDSLILYASTHERGGDACPAEPERTPGGPYLWPIYDSFDIYVADLNGNIRKKLTDRKGYDAEATVSPKGDKIVFTSDRSGDLELYVMNIDGSNIIQVTNELGYDGGAFFSPDGKKLIFRASRPKTEEEVSTYKEYLSKGLVAPTNMEIYICNVDGSDLKQVTNLGKANWAPYFHPSGDKFLFSSNHHSDRGYKFNIFMMNIDGTGLEQVTFDETFDSFPMFSQDGKRILFSSNRNNGGSRETNVFVADWYETK
jgi:Tol biopolymer transport system component